MARSDNLKADLDRIRSMPEAEFEARWGTWCRVRDRDVNLMRARWIADLEYAIPHAEREEAALTELIEAKEAFRLEPTAANRARRDAAVTAIQAIRAEERAERRGVGVAGDAFEGVA